MPLLSFLSTPGPQGGGSVPAGQWPSRSPLTPPPAAAILGSRQGEIADSRDPVTPPLPAAAAAATVTAATALVA